MFRLRRRTLILALVLGAAWVLWALLWLDRDVIVVVLAGVFPIAFGVPVLLAHRAKHRVLTLFLGAVFITHGILPAWFYLQRDSYAYSGWRAVKDFQFGLHEFFAVYWKVGVLLSIAFVTCLVLQRALLPTSVSAPHAERRNDVGARAASALHWSNHGLLLVVALLAAGLLNYWMYQRGLALTGFTGQQTALPFRLGGLLYYGSRLGIPAVVFLLYRRSSRGTFVTVAAVLYAGWAGMAQVSRMTFVLLLAPILYFAVADQRKIRLVVVGLVLLVGFQWITVARSMVLVVSETAVEARELIDLGGLVAATAGQRGLGSPARALYTVVARVGGPQEAVLGHQYDTTAMGGRWREFSRQYLGSTHVSSRDVQHALFGFIPPTGYSVGGGGFVGRMLMIANGNILVLLTLGVALSVFLTWGELLSRLYQRQFHDPHVGYGMAALCVIVLYAFGDQRAVFFGFFGIATIGLSVVSASRLFRRDWAPVVAARVSKQ